MKEFFRIPMQFFAEEGDGQPAGAAAPADGSPDPAPQGDGQQQNSTASTGKTFTQEELDRVVTGRLAREQKKFEAKLKEQEQQFAAKQEEAAQLAKMNADEKKKFAEEKREKDLTAREAAIKTKELRFEALNILNERKLPSQLIDCVNLESAEAAKQSIDSIAEAFEAAITAGVDAKLKSNPPAYSGGNTKTDPFLSGFMEG
jgi:hypothetical protein